MIWARPLTFPLSNHHSPRHKNLIGFLLDTYGETEGSSEWARFSSGL